MKYLICFCSVHWIECLCHSFNFSIHFFNRFVLNDFSVQLNEILVVVGNSYDFINRSTKWTAFNRMEQVQSERHSIEPSKKNFCLYLKMNRQRNQIKFCVELADHKEHGNRTGWFFFASFHLILFTLFVKFYKKMRHQRK